MHDRGDNGDLEVEVTITDEKLLRFFRAKTHCEICNRHGAVDPHHVYPKGLGGGSRLDIALNLISVCRRCHQRCDGEIRREVQQAWIAAREGETLAVVQETIARLLRTPKGGADV